MPPSFTIEYQAGDVTHLLTVVEGAFDDPSPLMSDALLVMIRSTQLTFEAQGRPNAWDELKESTRRARFGAAMKKKGAKAKGSLAVIGAIQILRNTGALMRSVGGGASGPFEADGGFGTSDDTTAVLGTNAPGWQNQFADTRGWRDAREFLLIQDQDESDIADVGIAWFTRTGPYAVE